MPGSCDLCEDRWMTPNHGTSHPARWRILLAAGAVCLMSACANGDSPRGGELDSPRGGVSPESDAGAVDRSDG
jgi:hypothetical protein